VTGYDNAVHRLTLTAGSWTSERVATLPGAGKNAMMLGSEVIVTSTDGSVISIGKDGDTWRSKTIDERGSGRSRLGTDGRRIIVSDDDGTLSVLTPSDDGDAWSRQEIHREFELQRGAVLADLDPTTPGLEAATAGFEFKISLLREAGGSWWSKLLFRDTDRLHHLVAGDVDGRPGLELIGCGYSGRVTVFRRR
jgi:hypothetical protein